METVAGTIKPNFFIVGKPKSGTTTLHSMLSQHPDIFMSREKEPHHFHRDKNEAGERRNRGYRGLPYKELEHYLKLFEEAKTQRVVGESSTGYLYSRHAAQEIAKFNPEAKILMIFREPVEFIYAMHSQLLRSANEDEPDFRKALLLEESRKLGKNIPSTTSYPDYLFYSEQVKYVEQAERFLGCFARSQVKILVYEDFRKDNLSVYNEVLEFLNVDSRFVPEVLQLQANKEVRFVKLANWLTYHGEKKKGAITQWAPSWLLKTVSPVMSRVFFKEGRRQALDPELRKELSARFKPEVMKLSEIAGVDLVRKWRYEDV